MHNDHFEKPLSEIFIAAFGLPHPAPKTEECEQAYNIAMRVLEYPGENWV